MCYGRDYRTFNDQKKVEEARIAQERRAQAIDRLLNDARKPSEQIKAEPAPVKDVAPAK